MIKLSKGGAYLINGTEVIEDSQTAAQEVAAKTGKNVTKIKCYIRILCLVS